MARLKLLLISMVVAALSTGMTPANALGSETGCLSWNATHFAGCMDPPVSGVVNGGGVDLSSGYDSGSGLGGTASGAEGGRGGAGAPAATPTPAAELPFVRDGFAVNCPLCDPNLVVSISDLVNFPAAVPGQGMEPNGWAITGLPANFLGRASVHVRSGVLLGFPADVRFTPTRFHWDLGDGTGIDSSAGGAPWAALGVPEFTDTATSHIFRSTGRHTVVLSVVYSAEYRAGAQPWRPVQGTLTIAAPPLTVLVSTASTVLVGQDCTANPAGPGC